ncbi:hypothetical protein FQA39_LY00416 [Lamprigera yunnana]|nr:hypothetical protein FQA39_LY00416 [Lamprigera yunnana]
MSRKGLSYAEPEKLANEFAADISDELQSESEDLLLEDSADIGNHSSDDSDDDKNINKTVTKDGTFWSKTKPPKNPHDHNNTCNSLTNCISLTMCKNQKDRRSPNVSIELSSVSDSEINTSSPRRSLRLAKLKDKECN